MIIASTPLRISLFGGSTDLPAFIEKHGRGAVISFAANLRSYVTISQDTFGLNTERNKYVVNYSKREEIENVSDIRNEIVRAVLERFRIDRTTISLTSDVFSQGSGLASSSSYILSLIKAVAAFNGMTMTDSEICSSAYEIELGLNPYCGLQDPYGCGLGGFKLLEFKKNRRVTVEFLPTAIFDEYDFHLIFTGVTRESSCVLKDVSKNIDKAAPLLQTVSLAHEALLDGKHETVLEYLNESWMHKKRTSELIASSPIICAIDSQLDEDESILAHKLCGAGNGGFFLCVTPKACALNKTYGAVKVTMSHAGMQEYRI